jgi:hypothetical protein
MENQSFFNRQTEKLLNQPIREKWGKREHREAGRLQIVSGWKSRKGH